MSDPARSTTLPRRARVRPAARQRERAPWVVAATAALVAALIGLVTLLLLGFSTGAVPFLTGLVVAALPAPVYVLLVLWIDRFESEPGWLLATAFFWGALVAVGVALIVNTLGMVAVDAAFGEEAADLYGLALSAPLVEEGAKALALFVLYFWKRDEFDGVLDGIVYASMVGLGFAMTENVKYYAEAALEGRALGTFVVRGMFSPYAHPLFTSMTGIGLGLASHAARRSARVTLPLVGLALAVVLHSIWNTSLFFSDKLERGRIALVMYFLVMVPVFAGVLMIAFFGLRKRDASCVSIWRATWNAAHWRAWSTSDCAPCAAAWALPSARCSAGAFRRGATACDSTGWRASWPSTATASPAVGRRATRLPSSARRTTCNRSSSCAGGWATSSDNFGMRRGAGE